MKSRLSKHLRFISSQQEARRRFSAAAVPADAEALATTRLIEHDPKLAPRDEAIFLLHTAAEVEHALMIQYLYAAYSLGGPQVPQDKVELVDSWQATIIGIAREEMSHLASVQNLLRFIGGSLNLEREDFPFRTALYPFQFKLEPLTKNSLAKYVYAEMPEGLTGTDIDEIRTRAIGANSDPINHVGPLYQSIASLFGQKNPDGSFSIKDEDLQAEPSSYQAGMEWTLGLANLILYQVKTRSGELDGAIPLIDAIAKQGEGLDSAEGMQRSHYRSFRDIYDAFPDENDWKPSRLIPINPNTSMPDSESSADDTDVSSAGRITHPQARVWAQLLNLRYRMLLTDIFHILHTEGSPSQEPKSTLLAWIFREMSTNISRISNFLVEMPLREEDTSGPPFAAPPFELPYTLSLATDAPNRWRLQRDLFIASQMLSAKIREVESDPVRTRFITRITQADATALLFAESQIRPSPVVSPPSPDTDDTAPGETTPLKRFTEVKNILEESVSSEDIGAHGNFWRDKTRDQFVALIVFGRPLLAKKADGTFDENESNLVKALQGRNPFGRDISTPGAIFRRMPAGLPAVPPEKVEIIRQWIKDGCPDDAS